MKASFAIAWAAALAMAGDGGWTRVGEHDGVLVERRTVAGSSVVEVRATGHTSHPPADVLDTVWRHREYRRFVPHLKHVEVLDEEPDRLLVYEQLALPLVRDRDYTIRLERRAVTKTGGFEVTFRSEPERGPPENDAHVRVRVIEGSWTIEPDGSRGTRASYTLYSDAGGAIPRWLVNRLQTTMAADFVRAMLARVDATHR